MLPGQAVQVAGLALIIAGILFKLIFTLTAKRTPPPLCDEDSLHLEPLHLDTNTQPLDLEYGIFRDAKDHLQRNSRQTLRPFIFDPKEHSTQAQDGGNADKHSVDIAAARPSVTQSRLDSLHDSECRIGILPVHEISKPCSAPKQAPHLPASR